MGRFDDFRIDLKGMKEPAVSREYHLDNQFFINIDGTEFQRGKMTVNIEVKKNNDVFDISFSSKGVVIVPCDRCLDDMDIEVETNNRLPVKLGADYSEEGDTVIIPEEDGVINIAWYIYEFIALALPMKHVHAPGKCNKEMVTRLNKHLRKNSNDEEEETENGGGEEDSSVEESTETDSRWDELKKIIDIDDN